MMPEPDQRESSAPSDSDLDELRGRIGNLYSRQGLSPPSQLYGAVKHWLGISHDEIIAAIEQHFAEHRRLYTCGSGDRYFYLVEEAVRAAWQKKHPARDRADDEPIQPRRRRAGRVREVHNAGGRPDLLVDERRAQRLFRDRESYVPRPSGLGGYEGSGEPIGEDDEADA